ncbi:MAG: hypothetical protein MMC23_008955 [Stictis urceolatum]|nr:hypothetical protein [Stictis urceolata]
METKIVNVLLTSFAGLGLPRTLCFPAETTRSVSEIVYSIHSHLPLLDDRFVLTTTSNKVVGANSSDPISTLLGNHSDAFIPLRLSLRLCGGKGGFGSQLRAAGGRMSSKRKKNRGEDHGSSRNLDGRRLRTVTEAKALAEYLALKPEMDRKEKEARRKRWEEVVELAEKREAEIKSNTKGKVDGKWLGEKEDAAERTSRAVAAAMSSGKYQDYALIGRDSSNSELALNMKITGADRNARDTVSSTLMDGRLSAPSYHGFDDDDFFSEEDEED